MYGTAHTGDTKVYLEMTTSDEKVPDLIDYINTKNNIKYDYPVPDVIVEPISDGNPEFLAWVKK